MLQPEVKERFLKMLRSGEFPQTKRALRRVMELLGNDPCPVGYCCLGILAVAAGGKETLKRGYGCANFEFPDGTKTSGSILGHDVRNRIGLQEVTETHLWNMNDQRGMSFAQIADWVEANL